MRTCPYPGAYVQMLVDGYVHVTIHVCTLVACRGRRGPRRDVVGRRVGPELRQLWFSRRLALLEHGGVRAQRARERRREGPAQGRGESASTSEAYHILNYILHNI